MSKLLRITLEGIEDLTDKNSVEFLGEGIISTSRWRDNYLKITYPKVTRIIRPNISTWNMNWGEFIEYADEILYESGLYLAKIHYKETNTGRFFPHEINGYFYTDIINF